MTACKLSCAELCTGINQREHLRGCRQLHSTIQSCDSDLCLSTLWHRAAYKMPAITLCNRPLPVFLARQGCNIQAVLLLEHHANHPPPMQSTTSPMWSHAFLMPRSRTSVPAGLVEVTAACFLRASILLQGPQVTHLLIKEGSVHVAYRA